MSTLYIDRKQSRLLIEGQSLVVYFGEQRQRPVPLALLERVVFLANVSLDSGVLLTLADRGIAVLLGSGRKPQRQALLLGAGHNNARLRVRQYECYLDEGWRLAFAQRLVMDKLAGQARLLEDIRQQRPDLRKPLTDALEQVKAAQLLSQHAESRERLLGLEGSAARAYFSALAAVFPASFGFRGRKRRPPPDAINACLSLAYTLLHGRAVQVLHAGGLDPLLGFYHELVWGRASLASDVIEPWRVHIDAWVWDKFRRQQFRAEDFRQQDGAVLLGKSGRQLFFGSLEKQLRPISRGLRWQVRALIREMGTGE